MQTYIACQNCGLGFRENGFVDTKKGLAYCDICYSNIVEIRKDNSKTIFSDYRLVREIDRKTKTQTLSICEVFFEGSEHFPVALCKARLDGPDATVVKEKLDRVGEALLKPILNYDDIVEEVVE